MIYSIFRLLYLWVLMKVSPVRYARGIGVQVGERCKFVAISGGTFGSEPYLISIGNHVETSFGVNFITHDGGVWVVRDQEPDLDVMATIQVGNNVFIGANSIILPGTNIGDDCVVGAGSVVRGEIPSGSVVAGVPAKVIKETNAYIKHSIERGVRTKLMKPAEKRKYLTQHFGI